MRRGNRRCASHRVVCVDGGGARAATRLASKGVPDRVTVPVPPSQTFQAEPHTAIRLAPRRAAHCAAEACVYEVAMTGECSLKIPHYLLFPVHAGRGSAFEVCSSLRSFLLY